MENVIKFKKQILISLIVIILISYIGYNITEIKDTIYKKKIEKLDKNIITNLSIVNSNDSIINITLSELDTLKNLIKKTDENIIKIDGVVVNSNRKQFLQMYRKSSK